MNDTKKLLLYLEPEMHLQFKKLCKAEGRTMTGLLRLLITERINSYLEDKQQTSI